MSQAHLVPTYRNAYRGVSPSDQDRAVDRRARALQETFDAERDLLWDWDLPRSDSSLRERLLDEAMMVARPRSGRPREAMAADLAAAAIDFLRWSRANTLEASTEVALRFAVDRAYDLVERQGPRLMLSSPRPRLWRWSRGRLASSDDAFEAPLTHHVAKLVRGLELTSRDLRTRDTFEDALLPVAWKSGWKKLRSLHCDPLRPPLVASALAAELVRAFLPDACRVLGVELGHSAGAQALAVRLRRGTVFTESTVFDPDLYAPIPKVDAVVLNVPPIRLMAYAERMFNVFDPVTRWEHDLFSVRAWRDDFSAPGPDHVEALVRKAVEHVPQGGALVVLADPDDGTHDEAMAVLDAVPDHQPAVLALSRGERNLVEKPYYCHFGCRRPWRPFDVHPPTPRLVTAWRRS